jgi:hypothetical protein
MQDFCCGDSSAKGIASGTFWFTAVNDKGDTVKVTNGRFDVHYTR